MVRHYVSCALFCIGTFGMVSVFLDGYHSPRTMVSFVRTVAQ